MGLQISRSIPGEQLRRLGFLIGECQGLETLYPPEEPPVQFTAFVSGAWEACERYLKIDFFAEIPRFGVESVRALITYSEGLSRYRMWVFSTTHEEPIYFTGDFDCGRLVFVSDPTQMVWGLQRLRYTFTPLEDQAVQMLGERWEPDGYAKLSSVVFRPE